jgi:CDP-glucose 4,6-dehydratase
LYEQGQRFAGAWNFGPGEGDMCSVGEVVQLLADQWPQAPGVEFQKSDMHEAGLLRLDSSRARHMLGWRPRWSLQECLERTLGWHLAWRKGMDMRAVSLTQLSLYRESL